MSGGNHITELLPILWYFHSFNSLFSDVPCVLCEEYGGVEKWGMWEF